jgi:flavodoxin
MKNHLILYYSKSGNSKFIAEKLALRLKCDSKRIIPWMDYLLIQIILSLFRINIPTNITVDDVAKFDGIIIIGPVWAGQLVSPLRTVLKLCVNASKTIFFAVTCETKDEEEDTRFGHNQVLKKARDFSSQNVNEAAAFSTSLVKGGNNSPGSASSDKIKITEENYSDELKERVEAFALKIAST